MFKLANGGFEIVPFGNAMFPNRKFECSCLSFISFLKEFYLLCLSCWQRNSQTIISTVAILVKLGRITKIAAIAKIAKIDKLIPKLLELLQC